MDAVKKRARRARIWEIDFLRGVCIILMVFDHSMLDLWNLRYWSTNFFAMEPHLLTDLSNFALFYWGSTQRYFVRLVVVATFLTLSGISSSLSRSNTKRLGKLTAAALIVNVVTIAADHFFNLGVTIIFGILHIIALSVLIFILMQMLWKNKYFYLGAGIIILILGFLQWWLINDFTYKPYYYKLTPMNFLETVLGKAEFGADAYGIIPCTGFFLVGAFLGETLYKSKKSLLPLLDKPWHTPITFTGRHTIWVYLIHQPVVFAIILGVAVLCGFEFLL